MRQAQLPGVPARGAVHARTVVALLDRLAAKPDSKTRSLGQRQIVLDVDRVCRAQGRAGPVRLVEAQYQGVVQATQLGLLLGPQTEILGVDFILIAGHAGCQAIEFLVALATVQAQLPTTQVGLCKHSDTVVANRRRLGRRGGLRGVGFDLRRAEGSRQAGVELVVGVPQAQAQPVVGPLAAHGNTILIRLEVVTVVVGTPLVGRDIGREIACDPRGIGARLAQSEAANRRINRHPAFARAAAAGLGGDDDGAAGGPVAVQHGGTAANHFNALDRIDVDTRQTRAAQVGLIDLDAIHNHRLVAASGGTKTAQVQTVVAAPIEVEPTGHAQQLDDGLVDGGHARALDLGGGYHAHAKRQCVGGLGETGGRHHDGRQLGRRHHGLRARGRKGKSGGQRQRQRAAAHKESTSFHNEEAKPEKCSVRRPRRHLSVTAARTRAATVLAGIRAGGATSIAFPSACSKRSVAVMEAEPVKARPLTVAGAAQVRVWVAHIAWQCENRGPSCFPLNCGV